MIVADTEQYNARSTVLQREVQDALVAALDRAASAAGLDPQAWHRQPSGDGELTILPSDVDKPALFRSFLPALDMHLRRYNEDRVADARIRVRIAIHQGLMFLASRNGFVGAAVVTAARLVDAPVFKTAFGAFPDATVGCIVSDGSTRM